MNVNKYSIRKGIATKVACVIMCISIGLSSCNYLDIDNYIDDEMPLDSIFSSKRYIEAFMWNAAGKLHDEGAIFGGSAQYTPGPMATDEAFCLFGTGEFQGMRFVLGEIEASTSTNFSGRWKQWYQIIRQCNTIFARIDEANDWTATDRLKVIGTTRFIRAYAYYNILANFGPFPILGEEILENNEAIEYYDRPRDTYDDCLNYICDELEAAAPFLPKKQESIMEFGRPTQGAAYGLVARLRVWHASDLYNGGRTARSYFGDWKRKVDGQHYIQQTPDPKRWAVAAAAAKRVMDMEDNGVKLYELHKVEKDNSTRPLPNNISEDQDPDFYKPFPEGAEGIDPYLSYAEMFNSETVENVNKELVWSRKSPSLSAYLKHSFPVANDGWNGMCVTQKIIDEYETIDGRSIYDPSQEYPYVEDQFTNDTKYIFSGYRLNSGVSSMYVDREARFYASIGFSECYWPMTSTTSTDKKGLTITYYKDSPNGKDGAPNPNDHPITGYVLKKYIHPSDAYQGDNYRQTPKSFHIIRYAEILLIYAEALNELEGSFTIGEGEEAVTYTRDDAALEEIKNSINYIRHRVGLPGYTTGQLSDREFTREKIKHERMLEFLYENQRFYDVRRWGDYEKSENEPIRGMNTAASKDSYYQRIIPATNRISNRVVHRKMIFLPIYETELRRIPSFDQNPGW